MASFSRASFFLETFFFFLSSVRRIVSTARDSGTKRTRSRASHGALLLLQDHLNVAGAALVRPNATMRCKWSQRAFATEPTPLTAVSAAALLRSLVDLNVGDLQ